MATVSGSGTSLDTAKTTAALPAAGLLFFLGVGGLLVVVSGNEIGASVAQGILLISLLLVLIVLIGRAPNPGNLGSILTGK